MANNPRHAEREADETTRKASEHTQQAGRAMSEMAERAARGASEAFRQNAEVFSNTWRNSSEAASQFAERSMEQFSRMFGLSGDSAKRTVQQSAGSVQALLDSSAVAASGVQTISGEWMRFMQDRVKESLDNFEELMSCRTPQDYVALQGRMVRDNVEALLQSARRTSALSMKLADDAAKRMSDAALVPR